MYTQVASKLFVAVGTPEVSQAIPMEGYNRARVEFTVFTGTLSTVEIWESNDLENWTLTENHIAGWAAPSFASPTAATPVQSAYIRLQWSCNESSCIVAGGVNLSSQ